MPRIPAFGSAILLLSLALSGCRKPAGDGNEAAPTGSASAAGAECATYTKALCDKVGADSSHCKAISDLEGILPPKACTAGTDEMAFTVFKVEMEQKPCTDLTERLCKDLGPETDACKAVRYRVPGFLPNQCTMMTERYPATLEEARRLAAKEKPLDAAQQATLVDGAKAALGPRDAKAKVVVFSDFQCPFSAQAAATLNVIRHNFGDKVYVVFRQFPLPFHEHAQLAAEASLAAAEQGKFWQFHDKVFANPTAIARDNLEAYAAEVGLDVARFKRALDKGLFRAAVDADFALGKKVNVEGTPTMFLNGKIVQHTEDAPAVVAAIDAELKR
jgi:protein-disulfide isomerase